VILAGGGLYYIAERQHLCRETEETLETVARLKVQQISQWRTERLADAAVLSESPFLGQALSTWLADPDEHLTESILARFRSLRHHYNYSDVLLLDTNGAVRLSTSGRVESLRPHALEALAEAISRRKACIADLHAGPCELPAHLDVITPLFNRPGDAGNPCGALLLRANMSQYLYPLIQSWPTPSRTAETLLVRRDGDSVLFLNELRHRTNAALTLQIPLTQKDVPAFMAVLGREGVVRGRDYRGVDVFSVLLRVPDSPWFMVAKMDSSEAMAVWREQAALIAGLLGALLLVVAGVGAMLWQRTQKRQYRAMFEAEAARRQAEERYRVTLMSVGDGVIVSDANGCVELLNPSAESLVGWTQQEARGQLLEKVFHVVNEETRRPVENPADRVIREGVVVGLANHTLLIARDGSEHPIADSGAPIRNADGAIVGVVLVFRDQSEERESERVLQRAGENLRAIVEASPVGILVIDPEETVVLANPAAEQLFGCTPSVEGQRRCGDVIGCVNRRLDTRGCGLGPACPDCQLSTAVRGVLRGGQPVDGCETDVTVESPSGHVTRRLGFSVRRVTLHDRAHVLVALQDVTETRRVHAEMQRLLEQGDKDRRALLSILEDERKMEGRLMESEQRYQQLFDNAQDGIALAEADTGRLVDCNEALCRLVERSKEELVGQLQAVLHAPQELVHGQSVSFIHAREGNLGTAIEERLLSASGKTIPVEIRAARIRTGGRDYLMGVFRDVSERNRMMEQVVRNERMNALGQMASGIAHDFNNCLMPILGFSDILLSHEDVRSNPTELASMVRDIRDAAVDARHVVQHLRDFYKPARSQELAPVDMNELIRSAVTLTRSRWKEETGARGVQVKVKTDLQEVSSVSGRVSDLREALTNIIFNAVDAMPKGGTIILASKQDGADVEVSVSDDGIGMSEEARRRCLEPFFTTKGTAGTGLGLSMTQTVIQQHHGRIVVQSEPGRGTTVTLFLPAADARSVSAPAPAPERLGEARRVLVIEDDVRVQALLKRFLASDGHAVTFATTGRDGIEHLGKMPYDIVITDRALPDFSGDEVARAVTKLDVQPHVIMLTGFGDIMKDKGEMPAGVDSLLSKPITLKELRRAISGLTGPG